MLSVFEQRHPKTERRAWVAPDRRLWVSTSTVSRPTPPRLDPRHRVCVNRNASMYFSRRTTVEIRMRPVLVVPREEQTDLRPELIDVQRYEDPTRTLLFHRADEPLDNRDAPVLPHLPETRPDLAFFAPLLVSLTELAPLIRDDVLRRFPCLLDQSVQERAHLATRWLSTEHGESLRHSREMTDGNDNPPPEGPTLRQRKRRPARPERSRGWNDRQINVPRVIRAGRDNPPTSLLCARSSFPASRTRAIGLFAHRDRVIVTARNARSTTPTKPDSTRLSQSSGNTNSATSSRSHRMVIPFPMSPSVEEPSLPVCARTRNEGTAHAHQLQLSCRRVLCQSLLPLE